MKERATFLKDIITEGAYLLHKPTVYDQQTIDKKWKEDTSAILKEWFTQLEAISDFTAENIETAFKSFLESKGLGIGAVLPNFRLLITGTGMGPSMFEICAFLGKAECVERMNIGFGKINK